VRIASLVISLCLFGVGTATAQSFEFQAPAMVTADGGLPSMTFRAGTSTIEVGAQRDVNVQDLLVAAKIRPNDDPQTIIDKVNAVRTRLYPDREIALTLTLPKKSQTLSPAVYVWRYYYLWNRSSRAFAWASPIVAAAAFMSEVRGTWRYYDCNGCSRYAYRAQIGTGGGYTRALTGGYVYRGFDFQPRTYGARADIVMYFFN
jgi:hypothetical protein